MSWGGSEEKLDGRFGAALLTVLIFFPEDIKCTSDCNCKGLQTHFIMPGGGGGGLFLTRTGAIRRAAPHVAEADDAVA